MWYCCVCFEALQKWYYKSVSFPHQHYVYEICVLIQISHLSYMLQSIPLASQVALAVKKKTKPVSQCRRCKRCRFDPWIRKIPLRRAWQPTLLFLLGESHGQRSLAVHRVPKSWTQLKRLSMHLWLYHNLGFPGGSVGKESVCSVGDLGSIPWLGRSPREGNSYPLQYSGLENSLDYGVAKSQTQLSEFHSLSEF